LAFAEEASESTTQNRLQISKDVGIIASGYPAALAEGLGASLLSLGYAYPLPWKPDASLHRGPPLNSHRRRAQSLHRIAASDEP